MLTDAVVTALVVHQGAAVDSLSRTSTTDAITSVACPAGVFE